jgi:hypothetical protein
VVDAVPDPEAVTDTDSEIVAVADAESDPDSEIVAVADAESDPDAVAENDSEGEGVGQGLVVSNGPEREINRRDTLLSAGGVTVSSKPPTLAKLQLPVMPERRIQASS